MQYRKGGGTYLADNCGAEVDENCTDLDDDDNDNNPTTITATTIMDLEEDTSYSVQVRAKNDEGTSAWSTVATLKTNKGTNDPPAFTDGNSADRSVVENTPSGRNVESPVNASDDSSNNLTYSLGGRDAALFTIVSSSGQIPDAIGIESRGPGVRLR